MINKIFFSSDFHCGHRNVAGPKVSNWPSGYRIFDSIEEMDRTILNGINETVGQFDTLYFLGDFCLNKEIEKIKNYRDQIICQNIIFILGNHDKPKEIRKVFGDAFDVYCFNIGKQLFFLSHYAHRVWNRSHHGAIHLYGHSHDSLDKDGTEWGLSMDVSVDSYYRLFNEWKPFSEEQILDIMAKRQIKVLDHHEKK